MKQKATWHLIDLDQEVPGFREFLSCWVCEGEELSFLVDPGPTSTIPYLVEKLEALGISRIDYILLTHIHLDHGGGVGELLRTYPAARVVAHRRGIGHVVDPARLWRGSLAVLGEVAEVYGEPAPVAEASIAAPEELEQRGIRVVETPGHAAHHISFVYQDALIAGEVIGIRCPIPAPHEHRLFLRPATPPRFILEEAVASIDRLLILDPMPERILFAHYGEVRGADHLLRAGRKQLIDWVDWVRELKPDDADDLRSAAEAMSGAMHERLLADDACYQTFPLLAEDIRERERHWLRQSLEGMLGYVIDPPRR